MDILGAADLSNAYSYIGSGSGSEGHVTVSGAGSTWTTSNRLNVGSSATGTLSVTGGGAVSTGGHGMVGFDASGVGGATVSGAASTWTSDDHLSVGYRGTGTLSVTSGGAVSNGWHGLIGWANGAQGAVTVSGAGSSWSNGSNNLYLGGGRYWNGSAYEDGGTGSGTLEITSGGSVSNSIGYVGYNSGASGEVTVSGAGSTWANASSLYVGLEGTGKLAITDGGSVSNTTGWVGELTGSSGEVTVSGAGSTWTNRDNLYVGRYGTGTLAITGGGWVSNSAGYVGRYAGSSGNVTVSGAGSTWTNRDNLYVGREGAGTLTIADGGAVTVGGTLTVANAATSAGTVNLQGGSLTAQSIAAGAGTANFNWTGGSLAITGAGGLKLDGGLLGPIVGVNHNKALSVSAATTVNSGVKLAVTGGSFSTNRLTVSGTALLRAGTISIGDTFVVNATGELEIAGQDLVLLSPPTLQGDLVLERTTLSVPSLLVAPGATFELSSGSLSVDGTFTNQNLVRMGVTGPATLRAGGLTNSGTLMGQGSIQAPVSNAGSIALSGDSNFTEDVTNKSAGKIIVSGGSMATFFDDVYTEGELRIAAQSSALFFGQFTGTGGTTGPGTAYMEGDLRPGGSPALVSFGGDLVLGPAAGLEIELGGLIPASQYDQVRVAGSATLGGVLDVVLIDAFEPRLGDVFTVMTFGGSVIGEFDTYRGLELGGGLWLEPRLTPDSLVLTAVPEPSTLAMLAMLCVGLLGFAAARWYNKIWRVGAGGSCGSEDTFTA